MSKVGSLKCPQTDAICTYETCYGIGTCILGKPDQGIKMHEPEPGPGLYHKVRNMVARLKGEPEPAAEAPKLIPGTVGLKCPHYRIPCYSDRCSETHCNAANPVPALKSALQPANKEPPAMAASNHTPHKLTPPCHTGVFPLMTMGPCRVWIGRERDVGYGPPSPKGTPWALRVCLIEGNGHHAQDRQGGDVYGNREARRLLPSSVFRTYPATPTLQIEWPDFGIPPLDAQWWHDFAHALNKVEGDVVLYCMGGHGRTGTAAAILYALCGVVKVDQCPVRELRRHYCQSIVESAAQIEYIEEITGRAVLAKPSHDWGPLVEPGNGRGSYTDRQGDFWGEHVEYAEEKSPGTPHLSNNAYRRICARKGSRLPAFRQLEDQEQVCVPVKFKGKLRDCLFSFDAIDKHFEFVAFLEDTFDAGPGDPPDPVG